VRTANGEQFHLSAGDPDNQSVQRIMLMPTWLALQPALAF
jgi:hypothetical protein